MERRGGTCSFTFGHKRMPRGRIASGFRFPMNAKLQVPPLRCAPVGMTKLRAAAYLGSGEGGWTESSKEGLHNDRPLAQTLESLYRT